MSANGFKTVVDIDLMGVFHVLRASIQFLNRPGASLNSITAAQAVKLSVFQAHVCAAKDGINMLTKCLAMECGPAGVGSTPSQQARSPTPRACAGWPAVRRSRRGSRLARGCGYAIKTDIAEMATFPSTDSARCVTVAIMTIDGGSELGDASGSANPEGF